MSKKRNDWCTHKDCKPLTQFKKICCGRMPAPVPHGKDFNTHRFCLKGAGDTGGVFDLQVNKSDCYWFGLLFDFIKKDINDKEPTLDIQLYKDAQEWKKPIWCGYNKYGCLHNPPICKKNLSGGCTHYRNIKSTRNTGW